MIKNKQISMCDLVSQEDGNIVSDMDGEKVMLSIHNGKYFNLGEIGGVIWEIVKEPISVQELIAILMARYDVEEGKCEEQVMSFLDHLLAHRLLVVQS